MNAAVISGLFIVVFTSAGQAADPLGAYFYEDLGCAKSDDGLSYKCPDFSIKNESCQFKKTNLKLGDEVDEESLKGSCFHCLCGGGGRIHCAVNDCFERLKSGCSHFKYSLDQCCPVDSVCGPIAKCTIDGESHQEGNKVYTKNTCEVCVCDVGFKQEAPFCRRRICYDQARYQMEVANFGAPAFFKGENCCPDIWVEGDDKIVQINPKAPADSSVSCKYGNSKVLMGYGFKKSVQPYGRIVNLTCECTLPPYVICREE